VVEFESALSGLWQFDRLGFVSRFSVSDGHDVDLLFLVFVISYMDNEAGSGFTAFFSALSGLVSPEVHMPYEYADLRRKVHLVFNLVCIPYRTL